MRKWICALLLSLLACAAQADEQLERRVEALASELRCLVCQNQTLADSHADLAIDLKNQVREKLAAGMSEREVADFMVQRYGDFVLYRPPVKGATLVLWFGPFILLALGFLVLVRKQRSRQRAADTVPPEELRRAAALLDAAASAKEKS